MPICLRLLTHWMRRAASRAAWTAGSEQRDQHGDDRDDDQQLDQGKPAYGAGVGPETHRVQTFPPGRAKGSGSGPSGTRRVCRRSASGPPGCSWPKHRTELDGQVFWLSARIDAWTAFPPRGSGILRRASRRIQRRPRDGFSPSSLSVQPPKRLEPIERSQSSRSLRSRLDGTGDHGTRGSLTASPLAMAMRAWPA